MRREISFRIWVCAIVFAMAATAERAGADNVGFVSRQGSQFELNGKTYYFSHANQYYLFYKSQTMVDEVFSDASGLGLNVMRTWASSEGVWNNGFCFQPSPGVYDENTFRKLDYVIYKANQQGIRLILPFVDNWNSFGGIDKYVEWSPTANSHDDFYTDATCKQWYKNYVSAVLNRVNTYTGVAYKNDPTIAIWELANEPRCESDTSGNKLQAWIDEMGAYIKSIDPIHLVSTGSEGWYKRTGTSDWKYSGFEGVDFIRNHQSPFIDVCSFHMYPNDWGMNEADALTWIQEHVTDAHQTVGKPVYGGEFAWEVIRSGGSTMLFNFSSGTDSFTVDWGYSQLRRMNSPSYDGNGSLRVSANLTSSQPNAGAKRDFSSPQDYSSYSELSAWIQVPSGSPSDLHAEYYVKSTSSWRWADGDDVVLVPGSWVQVKITPAQIAAWGGTISDIRQVGIQLKRGNTNYNGFVYYDLFEGRSGSSAAMDNRNRIYGDWYNRFSNLITDGTGFWILSGHQDDGSLYPDYDNYTVYQPEDSGTSTVIHNYSNTVSARTGTALPPATSLWDGCEVVGNWVPASSYSDATGISASSVLLLEGSNSLRFDYHAPSAFKAFYENSGNLGAGLNLDWSGKSAVIFEIYNGAGAASVDVALSTSETWNWQESLAVPIHSGWNTVVINLKAASWKSAATSWQNTGTLTGMNQIKRLAIGVFGYGASGSVYVDNIRLY